MLTQNKAHLFHQKNVDSSHPCKKASVIVPLKLMEKHQERAAGNTDSSAMGTMQHPLLNLKLKVLY